MAVSNLWWMAVKAVHQKILTLTLDGISPESRVLQPFGDEKPLADLLPAVSVSPYGSVRLDPNSGGNVMDDPGYPVLIGILDNKSAVITLGVDDWLQRWLLWRETIEAALHHKNGPDFTYNGSAITTQFDTVVTPGPVLSPTAWEMREMAIGTMVVRIDQRRAHV